VKQPEPLSTKRLRLTLSDEEMISLKGSDVDIGEIMQLLQQENPLKNSKITPTQICAVTSKVAQPHHLT
jgi:hypothetical protein